MRVLALELVILGKWTPDGSCSPSRPRNIPLPLAMGLKSCD